VIRRAVIALAAVVGLTSCSTLSSNDDVASVNGKHLSQDDLREMLESDLGQALLQDGPVDGVISGETTRGLITVWLQTSIIRESGAVTDEARTAAESRLSTSQASWDIAPQEMRDVAVEYIAAQTLAQTGSIDSQELTDLIQSADIDIDSRYGWWDRETLAVLAFE
jgi:hypothetical protein